MIALTPRRLLAFLRRNASARHRWEYIGLDQHDAYRMMDGSRCEDELRERGADIAGRLVAALQIDRAHRVLEVGCGVGRVGRELAPHCGAWLGVDLSSTLLARARRRMAHLDHVTFRHLPTGRLDGLEEASADRIICHKVLLHLDPAAVQALLSGFARVLRPDGLVYLDLWNRHDPAADALRRREAVRRRLRRQPHRSRFYARGEVERWLHEAGLGPVWMSDRTFLLQVVAMRADADEAVRRGPRRHLQVAGQVLLPGGDLDFEPRDRAARIAVPAAGPVTSPRSSS